MSRVLPEVSPEQFGSGALANIWDEPRAPYTKSVYVVANRNGCYEPEAFQRVVAEEYGINDPEEVARIASVIYSWQNFAFRTMVGMASEKRDARLLNDMVSTEYTHTKTQDQMELARVPARFRDGFAQAMARDEAFYICEQMAKPLGICPPLRAQWDQFFSLASVLSDVVNTSNTMVELHNNFFAALKTD